MVTTSLSNEEIIQQQLKIELAKDSDITLAILFGSCAKGVVVADSDIDIAVKLDKHMSEEKKIQIIQSLAILTGRAIDLVDLNKAGQPILSQIIKYGILIKGSQQAYIDMTIRNVYTNEDFLPYIKRSWQARREKWIR